MRQQFVVSFDFGSEERAEDAMRQIRHKLENWFGSGARVQVNRATPAGPCSCQGGCTCGLDREND